MSKQQLKRIATAQKALETELHAGTDGCRYIRGDKTTQAYGWLNYLVRLAKKARRAA